MFALAYKANRTVYLAIPEKQAVEAELQAGPGSWKVCSERLPGLLQAMVKTIRSGFYYVIGIEVLGLTEDQLPTGPIEEGVILRIFSIAPNLLKHHSHL